MKAKKNSLTAKKKPERARRNVRKESRRASQQFRGFFLAQEHYRTGFGESQGVVENVHGSRGVVDIEGREKKSWEIRGDE